VIMGTIMRRMRPVRQARRRCGNVAAGARMR
jgi:hypothetical protein